MSEFETHAFAPPAMTARGRAWKFGDFVDVEEMCMTRHFALPPDQLRLHVFERLRPDFGQNVAPGDLVVGGRAFGCGHGHDHANVALKTTGVAGIIATSFGSQFYRHAVDHAMPLITCPEAVAGIEEGHEIDADFDAADRVRRLRAHDDSRCPPPEPVRQSSRRSAGHPATPPRPRCRGCAPLPAGSTKRARA